MTQVYAPTDPVGNHQVSPDGTSLSFTSSRGDGPVPHDLFLMPVTGGEARNLTKASLDRPVGGTTWQRTGRLLAVCSEGFRSRCLTIAKDGTLQPLDGLEVNPVGPVAWSELGQLAFIGQSATELPEVYLMRTGCRAERVTGFNDSFRTLGLIEPEYFRFPSFDKTEIEGALYRPKGMAEGKRAPLFSKAKEFLRSIGARTSEVLIDAMAVALDMVTRTDIQGWFQHRCSYAMQ